MKITCKLILLTFFLAGTLCLSQSVMAAPPSFTSPITCIPADPSQPNTVYTLASNGNTINSILALGDLQIISIVPALPSAAATITITVKSLNVGRSVSSDCNHYLLNTGASQNFGFGKGVIRVNYALGSCGGFIDLGIFKSFTQIPPIIGPLCAANGDTITYSVCSILSVNPTAQIGFDTYTWGTDGTPITGLTQIYKSGDGSSVTYLVGPTWAGGVLSCKFGQCNVGLATLNVGIKTLAPSTIFVNGLAALNNSTTCVSTATSPINLVATAVSGTGYSYSWSTNNPSWGFGALATATTTSLSGVPVSLNINESSGTVYLTTVGGCNPRTDTLFINRILAGPLVVKRTDAVPCIIPGSTITFSVNNLLNTANVGNLNINWALPSGWVIVGPAHGSTITATAGPVGGSVIATGAVCGGSLTLAVNVQPAPPSAISGNTCVNQGVITPQTYSVTNVPPLTYTWSNTGTGWTSNGSTSNTVIFTPVVTATIGSINVIATSTIAGAGACVSTASTLPYKFNPTTPTAITVTSVCGNATSCIPGGLVTNPVVLTATGGSGTYNWTIPAGLGSLISSAGNTATISCLGNPGSFANVLVSCTNAPCTPSGTFNGTVVVSPAATATVTPNASPAFDVLSVSLNGGCTPTAYCWKLNNTGACVGTSQSLLVQNGVIGTYSWTVTINYGSCSRQITVSSRFSSRTGVKSTDGKETSILSDAIGVSPNPAGDQFILQLPANAGSFNVSIYSGKGELVKQQYCKPGRNTFNTSDWANGEYVIQITSSKGAIVTKKLVISK